MNNIPIYHKIISDISKSTTAEVFPSTSIGVFGRMRVFIEPKVVDVKYNIKHRVQRRC